MNINISNKNMIKSTTQYHEDSLSDEIEDLDSRIARYANVKSKPIGNFTDSDSDTDNNNNKNNSSDSSEEEEEEEEEEEIESQTESFNVSVRVRPLFSKEKMLNYKNIIRVVDNKYIVLKNPQISNKNDYLSMKRDRQKRFQFDNVFDNKIPTEILYKKTVRRLIKSILEGYNGTVFAYGATGSGKTYTMLGSDTEPGVMIHTLRDLFKMKEKQSDKYVFRIVISFLEIYNENIRDLLVKSSNSKKKKKYLDLRETPQKGVIIAGITFKPAQNVSEVMELLNLGNRRRTTESTAANKVSSRSHAILQIYVERKSKDLVNDRSIRCGKLNLIDLAGSEKGSVVATGNKSGMREGANINKSLLALSKCINALVDKKKFIPYRDSKLTRLLQDALGGNCKTVMICNISPSSNTWDDTHNTLKYADRAKNIRIKKAEINKIKNENKNDLNQVINDLKSQVNLLKNQLVVTKQEKKMLKRKSKLMVKEYENNNSNNSLGLLSEKDMQLLSLARDKLKNKMLNLDNLYLKLKRLNDNEMNLLSQQISMKNMLNYSENNMNENYELENKYEKLVNKINNIKLQKMEIEREIQFIKSNTNNEVLALVKAHSNGQHLHDIIDKENELFIATIDKKTTQLNMSFIENKYISQETQMKKIREENKKKNDILLQQNEEFKLIKKQLTQLKLSQEKTKEKENENAELKLQKQLTFYKEKYENDMREQISKQQKENELKLEKELAELKELKEKQLQLLSEQTNKPIKKENISPLDIPYNKWDKSDVYFWLIDDLNIDKKYAQLIYEQGFDGDILIDIKENDLKEIGINAMGIRKKIVKNIDLLQQKANESSMSHSTLATSVAWNSMYKGIGAEMNHKNSQLSLTDSVFSDLTSVSQMDAKKQMKLMQEQLKLNPRNSENPQFMMQMLHMFASSQQLVNNTVSPVPVPLPEDKEMELEMEMEEKEEKSKEPLMETNGSGNINGESNSNSDIILLKEKEFEAKQAVNKLVHRIKESMTDITNNNKNNILLPTDKYMTELTPGYDDREYDINFNNDNNEDSDENKPYDYDETWMYKTDINSFNIILLSPYKSLRKSFLKFCFEPEIILNRKRTMSYKRYEKELKCGNNKFIFRILECYESNYIPDLFDNNLVNLIIMLFPIDIFSNEINVIEKEFMDDLDTWLQSSGYWNIFWDKTITVLDKSLTFKKNIFDNINEYFIGNQNRIKLLNKLFKQFNVPNINNIKWINIETNKKSKLKICDAQLNNKKYKFKWPKIPVNNNEIEDWRLTLTLKIFNFLSEPSISYWLTFALFTPQQNLIAPTYQITAQTAYKQGPFANKNNNNQSIELLDIDEKIENEIVFDSPRAQSVELAQTKTDSVADNAAILEDEQIIIPMENNNEQINMPIESSVHIIETNEQINMNVEPSVPVMETNELIEPSVSVIEHEIESTNEEEEQLQKQLMQEAFSKFNEKKEMEMREEEEENDIQLEMEDEYMISGPPNQRNNNYEIIENNEIETGGDVTPPINNDFLISPSPFVGTFENNNSNGNSKPIINGYDNNNNNRRVSKAYHGYQPSWANLKTNKLQNTYSYYNPMNSNTNTNIYSMDDSDDEIDDELDFKKTKYSQQNTFSRKYVDANRNQSIMRYQDIFDQSTKAVDNLNEINHEKIDDFNQDIIDTKFLEINDTDIIQQRRGSKYTKNNYSKYNNNNNNNRNDNSNNSNNNYSSPIVKGQSVSSNHSYSVKREFGATNNNKNKKKGNMLKRMFAWTK